MHNIVLLYDQTLKPKIIQILKNKENNTDCSLTVLISRGCDHVLTFSRESTGCPKKTQKLLKSPIVNI